MNELINAFREQMDVESARELLAHLRKRHPVQRYDGTFDEYELLQAAQAMIEDA